MKIDLFPAGIEPATSPVWRVRDNHYTKETDVQYDYVYSICMFSYFACKKVAVLEREICKI